VKEISLSNPKIGWNLAIIWKQEDHMSQVAREFIRFAKERLSENNHKEDH